MRSLLRFRLRSLLIAVAVVCLSLALWKKHSEFRLTISAGKGPHTIHVKGRSFKWNGDKKPYFAIRVCRTLASGECSIGEAVYRAERDFVGCYPIDVDAPMYGPEGMGGRFDIQVGFFDGRTMSAAFGDLTIAKPAIP
ncbi:MAG TPA: hypothetical protein VHC22_07030 [Pirellulales bacterium]|nr:hypothetical protein [Pirellulales bacterium]